MVVQITKVHSGARSCKAQWQQHLTCRLLKAVAQQELGRARWEQSCRSDGNGRVQAGVSCQGRWRSVSAKHEAWQPRKQKAW